MIDPDKIPATPSLREMDYQIAFSPDLISAAAGGSIKNAEKVSFLPFPSESSFSTSCFRRKNVSCLTRFSRLF